MPIDGKDQGRRGRDRQGGGQFSGKKLFSGKQFPENLSKFSRNLNRFSRKFEQIFLKTATNFPEKVL